MRHTKPGPDSHPRPQFLVTVLALVAIAFCFAGPAEATTLVRMSPEEAANRAAAIVRATPIATEYRAEATADGQKAFVYTTLTVHEVLRGEIDASGPLVLKHPAATPLGGRLPGLPELEPGAEYVLFLAADAREPYAGYFLQALGLGAWRLMREGGAEWLERVGEGEAFVVDTAHGPRRGPERVRLERMRTLVAGAAALEAPSHFVRAPQVPPAFRAAPKAGGGRSDFTLAHPERPSRWFEPDTGAPVALRVNPAGHTAPTDLRAALDWAASEWSAVEDSALRVVNAGDTDACGFRSADPVSSVAVDCRNEIPGAGCRSGIIAIGGARTFDFGQTTIVNGVTFVRILTGDVVVNDDDAERPCEFFATQVQLNRVITHELGHVLGFGHSRPSPDPGVGLRPTMYPYIGVGMETLEADDEAGVRLLYPGGSSTPAAPVLTALAPETAEQGQIIEVDIECTALPPADRPQVRIEPDDGLLWDVLSVAPDRLRLRLQVSPHAAPSTRAVLLQTGDGLHSNALVFAVRPFAAPQDLSAAREGKRTARLTWTDSAASETGIVVERFDARRGAFVPITDSPLRADTTDFLDTRVPRKGARYRLVFTGGGGARALSNTAAVPKRQ